MLDTECQHVAASTVASVVEAKTRICLFSIRSSAWHCREGKVSVSGTIYMYCYMIFQNASKNEELC